MRILALDTGSDICALMLYENGVPVRSAVQATARDQAKILAPMLDTLTRAQGWPLASLDRLAVATGPGSFTGLRVGLAFVRGLSLALERPAYGFDHFHIMQHALVQAGCRQALLVRESKREELFSARMEDGQLQPYALQNAAVLAAQLSSSPSLPLTGDGSASVLAAAPELAGRTLHLAPEVFMRSLCQLAQAETAAASPAAPVYLREADVSFPAAKKAVGAACA